MSYEGIVDWFTKKRLPCDFQSSSLLQSISDRLVDSLQSSTSLRDFADFLYHSLKLLPKLSFIPADTRIPSFSLFSHLKNSSAIVTCLAVRMGLSDRQVCLLRLGALLHDIGKVSHLGKGVEHVKGTIDFLISVKDRLLSLKKTFFAESDFADLVKLASRHHTGPAYSEYEPVSELEKLVARAVSIASATDRQGDIVIALLDSQGNKTSKFEEATHIEFLSTDQFFPHIIKTRAGQYVLSPNNLSLKIEISKLEPVKGDYLLIGEDITTQSSLSYYIGSTISLPDNICVFAADIMGIQKFVMSTRKLAGLSGGSLLIQDLEEYISDTIEEFVCPETVIFQGGGSVLAFIPNQEIGEQIKEKIQTYYHQVFDGFLQVACVIQENPVQKLMKNFGDILYDIHITELPKIKNRPYDTPKPSHIPSNRICSSCYELEVSSESKEESYCSLCHQKIKRGKEYKHYISSLIKKREDQKKNYVQYELVELGEKYGLKPARELRHIGKNIAVLAIDGNMVGRFFSQINTISDYSYRSSNVDITIRETLVKTIKDIIKSNLSEITTRAQIEEESPLKGDFLGIEVLYVGGDDLLIITKSDIALEFVDKLCENIYTAFSFESSLKTEGWEHSRAMITLSVGVAFGNYKFPIYFLLEKAFKNLKNAKEQFRNNIKIDSHKTLILPHGAISLTSVFNAMPAIRSHDFILNYKEPINNFIKIKNILNYAIRPYKSKDKTYTFPRSLLEIIASCSENTESQLNTIKFLYARMEHRETIEKAVQYLSARGEDITNVKFCEYLAEFVVNENLREVVKDIMPVIGD